MSDAYKQQLSNNIDELPTWTDEQLQVQLDQWTTLIDNGGSPEITLTMESNSLSVMKPTLYEFKFNDQIINLLHHQEQRVLEWMQTQRHQIQLNRFAQMATEAVAITATSIETQQANKRDTQFVEFAKAVFEELWDVEGGYIELTNPHWYQEVQQIIAHRAYDLVKHAMECWDHRGNESMDDVLDLLELPEESN